VDGSSRHLVFVGRFAEVGPVAAGAKVKVRFPNPTTTLVEQVLGKSYNCTLRGHTVVGINPPGVNCPLYARAAMNAGAAPAVTVTRFVSDETNILRRIAASPRVIAGRDGV
jgi:hypothetical protein